MALVLPLYTVSNAGASIVIDGSLITSQDVWVEIYAPSGIVLANNWHLEFFPAPLDGTRVTVTLAINTDIDLNGFTFDVNGSFFTQEQLSNCSAILGQINYNAAGINGQWFWGSITNPTPFIGTGNIIDEAITLGKLADLTRGSLILGGASNRPAAVDFKTNLHLAIGDGTDLRSLANAAASVVQYTISGGQILFTFLAGGIVNAAINASAAIAWTKMAALTASKVVVTSAGGVITTANQLIAALGGTGIDTSASTGFPNVSSGTWSVDALTDVRHIDNLSFVTANQGTYYVYFPFACTVTGINVRVTSAVSGTDVGNLTIANNTGTAMTGDNLTAGVLEVAISAAFGTGYTSTLETNNTFAAGESMRITTSKTTTGGVVSADITFTRTGLV